VFEGHSHLEGGIVGVLLLSPVEAVHHHKDVVLAHTDQQEAHQLVHGGHGDAGLLRDTESLKDAEHDAR